MIIVCPQCESRYELGDDRLPQMGRAVRCTRCRAEWLAYPEPEEIGSLDDMPPRALEAAMTEAEVLTTTIDGADPAFADDPPVLLSAENVEAIAARSAPRRPRTKGGSRRLRPRPVHVAVAAALALLLA